MTRTTTPALRPFLATAIALIAVVVAAPATAALPAAEAQEAPGLACAKAVTVQPTGPRPGKQGEEFVNVEGTSNGKYTSFAVLAFPAPKAGAGAVPARVESLTLVLTQSVARFSKDGKLRVFLLGGADDPSALKFDEKDPAGLGDQLKDRRPLGPATFRKAETGRVDRLKLPLDDGARDLLKAQLRPGGEVRLLIVPDDAEVAATYFGTGADDEKARPRLTLDPPTP